MVVQFPSWERDFQRNLASTNVDAKTCQCEETKRQFLWSILLSTIEMTSKSSKHICSETTRLQLVGSLEFNYSTPLLWSISPTFSCIEPNPPIKHMKRSRGLSQLKSVRAAHMGISTEESYKSNNPQDWAMWGGDFLAAGIFFPLSNSLYEFFLDHSMNIF